MDALTVLPRPYVSCLMPKPATSSTRPSAETARGNRHRGYSKSSVLVRSGASSKRHSRRPAASSNCIFRNPPRNVRRRAGSSSFVEAPIFTENPPMKPVGGDADLLTSPRPSATRSRSNRYSAFHCRRYSELSLTGRNPRA